jgi:hypothetical protein
MAVIKASRQQNVHHVPLALPIVATSNIIYHTDQ